MSSERIAERLRKELYRRQADGIFLIGTNAGASLSVHQPGNVDDRLHRMTLLEVVEFVSAELEKERQHGDDTI